MQLVYISSDLQMKNAGQRTDQNGSTFYAVISVLSASLNASSHNSAISCSWVVMQHPASLSRWYSHFFTWLTSVFHSNSSDNCAVIVVQNGAWRIFLKLAVCKRSLKVFKEPPSHKVHFILPASAKNLGNIPVNLRDFREQVLSIRPLLFCELIGRSCSAHTHKLIVWTSTLRSIRVWWQKSLNSFNQLSNRIIGEFGMLREGQPWTCILPRTLAASMCWPHLHPRNQAYGKRRLSELGANDTLGRTPGW